MINEDKCIFFTSFVYENHIFLSEKEIQEEIYFRRNLYRNIVISLRKFEILKICIANIVIESKIELIWNVIRNMKMIHKYSHLLGDKVNYDGKIIKKDSEIQIINIKNKSKYILNAKIDRCFIRNTNTTKSCIIEFSFQNNDEDILSFSLKKININIYEYQGKCSMYILFFFNNIQKNLERLLNYGKIKKRELTKFKYIIENYNSKF